MQRGQWRGALMLSLICTWINGRVSNGEAGDLSRHPAHYAVIVMFHCGECDKTITYIQTAGMWYPANTQRTKNVIITSNRRFGVMIMCLLRCMLAGYTLEFNLISNHGFCDYIIPNIPVRHTMKHRHNHYLSNDIFPHDEKQPLWKCW